MILWSERNEEGSQNFCHSVISQRLWFGRYLSYLAIVYYNHSGANMAILGLIDGLSEIFVSISKAGSGYLSDRMHRRKVSIWLGYLFGAVSRVGYAFLTLWQEVIPFEIFDRLSKIRGAPRNVIVADISADQNRGRHFGLLRAMDNLGAVCGIIFCIAFHQLIVGYKNLFLLVAIASALSILRILYNIKEI